jgi:hypothetical protein
MGAIDPRRTKFLSTEPAWQTGRRRMESQQSYGVKVIFGRRLLDRPDAGPFGWVERVSIFNGFWAKRLNLIRDADLVRE